MTARHKLSLLKNLLRQMEKVAIAFSGGVDSTFLVRVAFEVLGENAVALTAQSPSFPVWEFNDAVRMAREIGVRHVVIETDELREEKFRKNPPNRCYYCKKVLFEEILRFAEREDIPYVLEGSNADDTRDFRPGLRAVRELGIRSPLLEAELGKNEIRDRKSVV